MNHPKDILVLFSYRNHKYGYIEMLFNRLQAAAQGRPLALFRGSLSDLQISIKNGRLSIVEALTGRDLNSFDLVYFELWYKAQQQALAAARYLKRHEIPYFSKELHDMLPLTKIGELAVLADNNIPLPQTFISSRRELKKIFKKNPPIAFPLVVKAADGYGGKNNHLVKSYSELKQILDEHKGLQFVVQEFIPNDRDYRCLVFGGEIKLVLERVRSRASNSHLNNTSAGAEGKMVPLTTLSQQAQEKVLAAAAALNRSEFAGVDLMLHKETGQPYILEVNQTPQIEIGAEVNDKMDALLDYLEQRTGAKQ